jgi:hypothetical protein
VEILPRQTLHFQELFSVPLGKERKDCTLFLKGKASNSMNKVQICRLNIKIAPVFPFLCFEVLTCALKKYLVKIIFVLIPQKTG